jgi:hypothetical protein
LVHNYSNFFGYHEIDPEERNAGRTGNQAIVAPAERKIGSKREANKNLRAVGAEHGQKRFQLKSTAPQGSALEKPAGHLNDDGKHLLVNLKNDQFLRTQLYHI